MSKNWNAGAVGITVGSVPRSKDRRRIHAQTSGLERAREHLWAYGLTDLARLFGMSLHGVREAVWEGRVDPASLPSIIAFALWRRSKGQGALTHPDALQVPPRARTRPKKPVPTPS